MHAPGSSVKGSFAAFSAPVFTFSQSFGVFRELGWLPETLPARKKRFAPCPLKELRILEDTIKKIFPYPVVLTNIWKRREMRISPVFAGKIRFLFHCVHNFLLEFGYPMLYHVS